RRDREERRRGRGARGRLEIALARERQAPHDRGRRRRTPLTPTGRTPEHPTVSKRPAAGGAAERTVVLERARAAGSASQRAFDSTEGEAVSNLDFLSHCAPAGGGAVSIVERIRARSAEVMLAVYRLV